MQKNSLNIIRSEEFMVGRIELHSDNILRQYFQPKVSFTKEMVISEGEALDKISNGIKYPRIVFDNKTTGATRDAILHSITKEFTSKYIVSAVVSEGDSKVITYIKGAMINLLALTQRNRPKIKFVSSKEQANFWIKKIMDFPYVNELHTFTDRDFKILNLWLYEYSTVEIADEIKRSVKTVERELRRLWGLLGTDKRMYIKEIFEYSEGTGKIEIPYTHITRDDLITIYQKKESKKLTS